MQRARRVADTEHMHHAMMPQLILCTYAFSKQWKAINLLNFAIKTLNFLLVSCTCNCEFKRNLNIKQTTCVYLQLNHVIECYIRPSYQKRKKKKEYMPVYALSASSGALVLWKVGNITLGLLLGDSSRPLNDCTAELPGISHLAVNFSALWTKSRACRWVANCQKRYCPVMHPYTWSINFVD